MFGYINQGFKTLALVKIGGIHCLNVVKLHSFSEKLKKRNIHPITFLYAKHSLTTPLSCPSLHIFLWKPFNMSCNHAVHQNHNLQSPQTSLPIHSSSSYFPHFPVFTFLIQVPPKRAKPTPLWLWMWVESSIQLEANSLHFLRFHCLHFLRFLYQNP